MISFSVAAGDGLQSTRSGLPRRKASIWLDPEAHVIELADALVQGTGVQQVFHSATTRGAAAAEHNQGAGCRARRQIENARNRLTSAIAQWGAFSLLTHTQHQVPLLNVMPGYAGPNPYSS